MAIIRIKTLAFQPGSLFITLNAAKAVHASDVIYALARHLKQDWGLVDREDSAANDRAVAEGAQILSAYRDRYGTKFWIVTDADRSMTSVLLPEEY